jgi:hypothetical protein
MMIGNFLLASVAARRATTLASGHEIVVRTQEQKRFSSHLLSTSPKLLKGDSIGALPSQEVVQQVNLGPLQVYRCAQRLQPVVAAAGDRGEMLSRQFSLEE